MDEFITIKTKLFNRCIEFVNQREETVHHTIRSNQTALASETKSSAGDKHETGRAMLQLEMEKASQQLDAINEMKMVLSKIKIDDVSKVIKLGSVIITDQANYYLAISAGELNISGKTYYAISPGSPIGKLLLGKYIGDSIIFNQKIVIEKIY